MFEGGSWGGAGGGVLELWWRSGAGGLCEEIGWIGVVGRDLGWMGLVGGISGGRGWRDRMVGGGEVGWRGVVDGDLGWMGGRSGGWRLRVGISGGLNSIQKTFNHPTRGSFCCGHGGIVNNFLKKYIKLREQYNKHDTTNKSLTLTII